MSNDKQENFTSILHDLPGTIRHSGELEHLIDFANMLILENEALKKQIKRLESRSSKLGKQSLKCKNDLRNPSVDENVWKQYNKANRSGGNE